MVKLGKIKSAKKRMLFHCSEHFDNKTQVVSKVVVFVGKKERKSLRQRKNGWDFVGRQRD